MFKENTKIGDTMKMSGKKKMEEGLHICGKIRLVGSNYNQKGVLEQVFDKEYNNLITNAGFDAICAQIANPTQPNEFGWMAIGTGVAGDATATTLTTETHRSTVNYAHTGGTKIFTLTATFTTVAAATEYGCLNAASVGTLLNIAGFAAITIDSLQIVTTMTLS